MKWEQEDNVINISERVRGGFNEGWNPINSLKLYFKKTSLGAPDQRHIKKYFPFVKSDTSVKRMLCRCRMIMKTRIFAA